MGAYQTFLYRKERNEALSGSVVARDIGLFKGYFYSVLSVKDTLLKINLAV